MEVEAAKLSRALFSSKRKMVTERAWKMSETVFTEASQSWPNSTQRAVASVNVRQMAR
jgi:hypothetical protein